VAGAGGWNFNHGRIQRLLVISALAVALAVVAFSAAPAFAAQETPEVTVEDTTAVVATPSAEALLRGVLNPAAAGEEGTYEFLYKKSQTGVCSGESETAEGLSPTGEREEPAEPISGLTPGTEYAVCLRVENNAKTESQTSTPVTFTTAIEPEAPLAKPANPIATTTTTLHGVLNPAKARAREPGTFEFRYRESASECEGENGKSVSAPAPPGLSEGEPVQAPLSELLPATQYTFCLVAVNEAGEISAPSAPVTFRTLAAQPTIAGESVSAVEATAATLDAEINPGGAATTAHFEYLSQAQYEANGDTFGEHTIGTRESPSVGSDDSVHPVPPARIAEQGQPPLTPSTTYRYRVVATNTCEGGRQCVTHGPGKTFTTYPAPGSEPPHNCSNEARRVERASTYLPDCRAYELVTPAEKGSGEPGVHEGLGDHAAVDGEKMAWWAQAALPGSVSPGMSYLSTRGPDGWSSENTIPPQSVENGVLCPEVVGIDAWSANLERGVLADGLGQEPHGTGSFNEEGFECGHDEPRLAPVVTSTTPGELEGFQNLFIRDNENFGRDGETGVNPYQLVNVTPSGVAAPEPAKGGTYYPAFFLAGSADLSHVVFEEELPLTANAPGYPNEWDGPDDLYEWTAAGVRLVAILPDGTPVQGSLAGATTNNDGNHNRFNIADYVHAVSEAGSRVFFQAGGNLYVRENAEQPPVEECATPAKACTIQVDASQASGPGGGGEFMAANAAGTKVFFMDEASAHLTEDTKPGSGENLYEYDLESATLTDLTSSGEADVQGVSGTGEDGSDVYFVATGALTGPNAKDVSPKPAEPNLYVSHGGVLTFIATLAGGDACDWVEIGCAAGTGAGLSVRVSANGAFIGFTSTAQLTGYDNTDASTHSPDSEIYLYDAATETLSCASCNPSGAAPTAGAAIDSPVAPYNYGAVTDAYPQRYVSDNGQVFFTSSEALLTTATNAEPDVYEYEGGELHLISSGTSDEASYFLDASVDGSDVFFETAQQLLGGARDAAYAIYDARVDGGFPEPPAPVAPCASDEACAAASGGRESNQSVLSTPASASFLGAGNLVPPPPVVVKPKSLTRAQKLANALKACKKEKKKAKRKRCEASARGKYGAKRAKKSARTNRRGK
jgi:hypothetical protein